MCWEHSLLVTFLKVGFYLNKEPTLFAQGNKKTQRKQCQTPNAKKKSMTVWKTATTNNFANGPSYCGKVVHLGLGDLKANHMFWKYDHHSNKISWFFGLEQWLINKTHGCMGWLVCVYKKWGWIAVAKHKYQKQNKENKTKLPTIHLRGCHWTLWWKRVGQDTAFRLLVYKLLWVGSPLRTQTPLVFGPVKRNWPIFACVLTDFKWILGDVKRCLSYPYVPLGNPERFWTLFEQI